MITDVLLDADLDLREDVIVGDATRQHQELLLRTNAGEWKLKPTTGIGIDRFFMDDGDLMRDMTSETRKGFEADGMNVNHVKFRNGVLNVDASYEG